MKYDIAVIGAGPGGYTAAAKAGRLGRSVVLFEKSHLGGTCLNRGCIPTKALLHSAELLGEIKDAGRFGIKVSDVAADQKAMHQRKNEIVESLRGGYRQADEGSQGGGCPGCCPDNGSRRDKLQWH